jgi:hypothetical protein
MGRLRVHFRPRRILALFDSTELPVERRYGKTARKVALFDFISGNSGCDEP